MKKNSFTKIRVRYGETDQMGVVHHVNYGSFFEVARIDWLDTFGMSYKKMEDNGVMLPVYEMGIRYKKPAIFDQEVEVETVLRKKPTAKIEFDYIIRDADKNILTTGFTTLVFTDAKTKRPIRCPDYILQNLGFEV